MPDTKWRVSVRVLVHFKYFKYEVIDLTDCRTLPPTAWFLIFGWRPVIYVDPGWYYIGTTL